MKNKNKNRFFLFCFSLLPGAGEMYLGFMRRGLSLMTLFWGIILLCSWLEFGPFLFLLPILWFYSFFHVHNLKKMSEEDFQAESDDFLFGIKDLKALPATLKQFQMGIAAILILLGVSILWNCLIDVLYLVLPGYLFTILHGLAGLLPQIAAGVIIIALGLYFIRGKKIALEQDASQIEERR